MTKEEKRFVKLGWTILEAKYFYYHAPESPHNRSDIWYDNLEDEYKVLAKKLNKPESATTVGFPQDSASGKLVAEKCNKENFKYTLKLERA